MGILRSLISQIINRQIVEDCSPSDRHNPICILSTMIVGDRPSHMNLNSWNHNISIGITTQALEGGIMAYVPVWF